MLVLLAERADTRNYTGERLHNSYPNSVDNNHHQYRFEVHSDTSTSTLLTSLNDPAFARGA